MDDAASLEGNQCLPRRNTTNSQDFQEPRFGRALTVGVWPDEARELTRTKNSSAMLTFPTLSSKGPCSRPGFSGWWLEGASRVAVLDKGLSLVGLSPRTSGEDDIEDCTFVRL